MMTMPKGTIVRISNFPHEWNEFTYEESVNATAMFYKSSNSQKFEVPVSMLSRASDSGTHGIRSLTISGKVGLRDDGMHRLGEWFIEN